MSDTAVPLAEAGVASAGFAIARLLSAPPDARMLELFARDSDRASWPIHNDLSDRALDIIAKGFVPDAVRDEWVQLLGECPDAVELRESRWRGLDSDVLGSALARRYASAELGRTHLGEQRPDHLSVELAYLAHLTADLARAIGQEPDEVATAIRGDLASFRREHVDTFCGEALAELGERARTAVLRAVPGLTAGFLAALDGLIATAAPGPGGR